MRFNQEKCLHEHWLESRHLLPLLCHSGEDTQASLSTPFFFFFFFKTSSTITLKLVGRQQTQQATLDCLQN